MKDKKSFIIFILNISQLNAQFFQQTKKETNKEKKSQNTHTKLFSRYRLQDITYGKRPCIQTALNINLFYQPIMTLSCKKIHLVGLHKYYLLNTNLKANSETVLLFESLTYWKQSVLINH